MITVNIKGREKSYNINFDKCDIKDLKEKITADLNNYIVVISQKVDKLYGKILGFDKSLKFVLRDGEDKKNFKNYKKILEFCAKRKLSRKDGIIAIGGGVVGDLAGFAASTYMRGIKFIQVPTTLLACVDSSVGGKTAINTDFGKNTIGSFYQPTAVFINTKFLQTLDLRNFNTGLGEIIKYVFIEKSCQTGEEPSLINFLNENIEKIFNRDEKILENIIRQCIRLKVSVVEKDEKEEGLRKILNFGHTYGHALEKITNYKKYTHGECVVEGIYFAFDLALKNNLIDKSYMFFMEDLLKKFDFKRLPKFPMDKIIALMKTDKKSSQGYITLILPVDYFCVNEFRFNDLLNIENNIN